MATTPIGKFQKVIQRCEALCGLHERLRARNDWQNVVGDMTLDAMTGLDVDDVVRLALALAVSAMDAYFRDKFMERLIPYATAHAERSSVLAAALIKANVSMTEVLDLLGKDRPHRTLRNKIAAWLQARAMHDLDQVDALFQPFGINDLTKHAGKKTHRAKMREKVVKLVERRHDIVHYADYFQGKRKVQPISAGEVRRQIGFLRQLVECADQIIDSATG